MSSQANGVEHVRFAVIRPSDVLCDAWGQVIGAVVVSAHPSPCDYTKESSVIVETPEGNRFDVEMPAGARVWRKSLSRATTTNAGE